MEGYSVLHPVGHLTRLALGRLKRRSGATVKRTLHGDAESWQVTGHRARIEVEIDPARTLAASLDVLDENGGSLLCLWYDNEEIPIAGPALRGFAREIEDNIVALLDEVPIGRVYVGRVRKRAMMIVPTRDGYARCRTGSWTSLREGGSVDLATAKSDGTDWRPVDLFAPLP